MSFHPLATVPDGSLANKVDVATATIDGRAALRLTLDATSRTGTPGADYVDQPSFLLLPEMFQNGVLQVDVMARLLPDAPDYARGFIGLAYRVQPGFATYESVYIRPTNGRPHAPGAPRDQRAVQYYAYPDWPFDTLRDREPGRFEAGADIALAQWHRLRIELQDAQFTAFIDGAQVLTGMGKIAPQPGQIGLWVDIGTDGYFTNLTITPS